jgi:hypothetical protein
VIVFSVSQYVPNIQALKSVVNFGDEAIPITFDIEHCPPRNRVGIGESFTDIDQVLPRRSLSDAKPNSQWGFEVPVPSRCFLELLAADDVQRFYLSLFRIMRTLL